MCKVLASSVARHKCLMCGNSYKEEDGEIPQEDLIADGNKSHSCVEEAGAWPSSPLIRRQGSTPIFSLQALSSPLLSGLFPTADFCKVVEYLAESICFGII